MTQTDFVHVKRLALGAAYFLSVSLHAELAHSDSMASSCDTNSQVGTCDIGAPHESLPLEATPQEVEPTNPPPETAAATQETTNLMKAPEAVASANARTPIASGLQPPATITALPGTAPLDALGGRDARDLSSPLITSIASEEPSPSSK